MVEIYSVKTGEDVEVAKVLFSESNICAREMSHDFEGFSWMTGYWQGRQEEVRNLPGEYGKARGCILIARYKGEPAGCIGLLDDGSDVSEMTYVYVRDEFRGLGIGKSLVKAVIERARNAGFKTMRLHTNLLFEPAVNLYKSLGFEEVSPDKEYPAEIKDLVVHMELKLV